MGDRTNSMVEARAVEQLKVFLRHSKKKCKLLVNHGYNSLSEYLALPETYDVSGPDFEEFCKQRMQYYLPKLDILQYLETPIVHPQKFTYDLVFTYPKKQPLFVELNHFYHYYVIEGKNSYQKLAKKLAEDYAKKQLIQTNGCNFMEVRTVDVDESVYLQKIKKAV